MFSFLALSLASLVSAQQWSVGQSVKTTSGDVKGQSSSWKSAVSEYLGVPYAQPPVGDLRWTAPKDVVTSKKPIDATKFSATCLPNIQMTPNGTITYENFQKTLLGVVGQVTDTFDEDCLTLNIWTKPQSGEKKKAVMVWIYGGGFGSGNTKSPMYNGARLAEEHDVIVVSINYRVNIFGFPRAPFLPDQNLGLLDQRKATVWVRDNIAAFGGDPSRITLFGQSAGGGSTEFYSYAWTKDPIISGFIVQSGAGASLSPGGSAAANLSAPWWTISQRAGCGGVEAGEKSLACMRSKPWKAILDVMDKRKVMPDSQSGAFTPVADGKVVFSDVAKRRSEGNFIKAPILVGNTDNELGFYQFLAKAMNMPFPKEMGMMGAGMGCGPHAVAAARRKAGISAWRYLYAGDWPNTDIGVRGAWHMAEIPLAFGTTEFMSHIPDTEAEKKLGLEMRLAWTNFAKDPTSGPSKMGWPLYDEKLGPVIHLGGENSSEVIFEPRSKYDSSC